jgi:hypothetical protein
MPFKSQAQRRKFAQLLVQRKISAATFEEWNRETGAKRLPEHVGRKRKSAKKSSTRRARSHTRCERCAGRYDSRLQFLPIEREHGERRFTDVPRRWRGSLFRYPESFTRHTAAFLCSDSESAVF